MVDKDIISTRISKIKESRKLLLPLSKISKEEFAKSPDHYLKAERLLELIIQSVIDIASHIVAAMSFEKPQDYHHLFDILIREDVFPEDFSSKLHGLVGLRNILSHEYLKIDHYRLYDNIVKGIDDFNLFCRYVIDFLEKGKD